MLAISLFAECRQPALMRSSVTKLYSKELTSIVRKEVFALDDPDIPSQVMVREMVIVESRGYTDRSHSE